MFVSKYTTTATTHNIYFAKRIEIISIATLHLVYSSSKKLSAQRMCMMLSILKGQSQGNMLKNIKNHSESFMADIELSIEIIRGHI